MLFSKKNKQQKLHTPAKKCDINELVFIILPTNQSSLPTHSGRPTQAFSFSKSGPQSWPLFAPVISVQLRVLFCRPSPQDESQAPYADHWV